MSPENLSSESEYANWQAPINASENQPTAESVERKSDNEEYAEALDAITTLADDFQLEDDKAISLITDLLREQLNIKNRWFPHLVTQLDPDSYSKITKDMFPESQHRLRQALEQLADDQGTRNKPSS